MESFNGQLQATQYQPACDATDREKDLGRRVNGEEPECEQENALQDADAIVQEDTYL